MSRNAVIIAEVFVVLALLFLVQSVVNFSLANESGDEDFDLPEFFFARISQEPAGSNNFDHLEYLVIGTDQPRVFMGMKVWKLDHEYRDGSWMPYSDYTRWTWLSATPLSDGAAFARLRTIVKGKYGVSLDIIEVLGQKVISIAYGPGDLKEDLIVRAGFSACELTDKSHPIVIQSAVCKAAVEPVSARLTLSAADDFYVRGGVRVPRTSSLRVLAEGVPDSSGNNTAVGEVTLRLTKGGIGCVGVTQ